MDDSRPPESAPPEPAAPASAASPAPPITPVAPAGAPPAATVAYASRIPYVPERIHAAAIYCSDGRVGEHFDDFLLNGLKLPRYDRLAIPGGAACLAGHTEAHLEETGVVDELRFLVEAHALERVVLIAHAGCAFYGERLHLPQAYLEAQQKIDLVKAACFVRRVTGVQNVEGYLARPLQDRVVFEPVVLE